MYTYNRVSDMWAVLPVSCPPPSQAADWWTGWSLSSLLCPSSPDQPEPSSPSKLMMFSHSQIKTLRILKSITRVRDWSTALGMSFSQKKKGLEFTSHKAFQAEMQLWNEGIQIWRGLDITYKRKKFQSHKWCNFWHTRLSTLNRMCVDSQSGYFPDRK